MKPPEISVVIPYFDDQPHLDLLLAALGRQTALGGFEVIVADDGSPQPPTLGGDLGFPCTLVRQDDQGFRAGAARNLGAAAAVGRVILFLDGDTLPSATYVQAMTEAIRASDDGHGVLVVGRRKHFHRGGASAREVLELLAETGRAPAPGVELLADPAWLAHGYRRTDNLRAAGDEDFRLVISAVLGVDRTLWDAIGGFDESFVGYGGEDWDLGWRAWLSGARWRYVPEAVAWHDGAESGARSIPLSDKNAESIRLAATVPLRSTRGTGLVHELPAVAVRYLGDVTGDSRDAATVVCLAGLLDGTDAGVWFPVCSRTQELPPLLRADPRVHVGDLPENVASRVVFTVDVHRPLQLPTTLEQFCRLGDRAVPGWLQSMHTRSSNRGVPPTLLEAGQAGVQAIDPDVSLERLWGGW